VRNDQELGKHLHLNEAVWIGCINGHREFRGGGLGTILFACMGKHIVQTSNKKTMMSLFTNNRGAQKIYRHYGFRSQGFIQNNAVKTQDEMVGGGAHDTNPDDRLCIS
jgi:ribosomal protein S18 acetylase RimI-like enzyme